MDPKDKRKKYLSNLLLLGITGAVVFVMVISFFVMKQVPEIENDSSDVVVQGGSEEYVNDSQPTDMASVASPTKKEKGNGLKKGQQPVLACNKSQNNSGIEKPKGVFTSVLTEKAVINQTLQGGLVRVNWADIEKTPGVFDFSLIDKKMSLLPVGKKWSLAIHGGWSSVDTADPDLYDGTTFPDGTLRPVIGLAMSPSWLESKYNIDTFSMEFRKVTVHMPKYWDSIVQERLSAMLNAVADRYKSDSNLQLVYVPQMTSNGIEGHFNGVSDNTLMKAAGIDVASQSAREQFADIWVQAGLDVAKITAQAFNNKAVAFEVHEVLGTSAIPERIMDGLLSDAEFENRVGIAMWWISGGDAYQSNLLASIKNYTGDVYAQVIGNSSQAYRFPNGDYSTVFTQAKDLCIRYIEPWNYEFENNTNDSLMTDFNSYAEAYF